jgi:hypothetical protein
VPSRLDQVLQSTEQTRVTLLQLLKLPEDSFGKLRLSLTSSTLGTHPTSVSDAEWQRIAAVFRLLYSIARESSAAEVVNDLHTFAENAEYKLSEETISALSASLQINADYERQELSLDAREFMPAIAGISAYLDLRVVENMVGETLVSNNPFSLVPILLVRFDFDEPIQGVESLALQVPWDVASDIVEQLQAAIKRRGVIGSALPQSLTSSIDWFGGSA